jgi:2-polyprenyl-3-methyl-5-hydroxy-6-metoxy-1,4-benzoquinol methylase
MILPRPSKKLIASVYENEYRNKRLQPHLGVDNRLRYAKTYRPTVFAEYAQSLEDLAIKKRGVKSVLDFGCADGIFLEFCKKHFNADTKLYGTDLSEDMLGEARKNGWNVFPLAEVGTLKMKFDLITLWDVIEHVEDPGTVLSALKKLLAPKGRIVIETPRFGALGELFGEQWEHLLPVQHLSIASKEGMQIFARRMGLAIEKHRSFSAHAPGGAVPQPYKQVYDRLAKELDFGGVQIVSLKRKIRA